MDTVVRDSPLFRTLDDDTAEALYASMSRVTRVAGETIFREGDSGDSVYLVVSGQAKVVRVGAAGRENLLAVLGPGQIFGELSLLDLGPRDATASAVAATELLVLSHVEMHRWLEERPAMALGLLTQIAKRLRRANDVVADLVFADVPTRVARTLVDLAAQFGTTDGESPDGALRVPHGLTQSDLAQLVGAARETVNKSLATFAATGLIRLERRAVVILDPAGLDRRAA